MRKWINIALCMFILSSCANKQVYTPDKQTKTPILIAQDAYFIPGQTIYSISKSNYEKNGMVYYVKDELELTKVLLYEMENGTMGTTYQSDVKLDIDTVGEYLSLVTPYNLQIKQDVTTYKNGFDEVLYTSYQVYVDNLDTRYMESFAFVQDILDRIIKETMSNEEKIVAIHDFIIQHSYYKENATDELVFQAAGVFLDQGAVCTGYSRAFMMLARAVGIPTVYVPSEQMNHSWNYVYDGSNWRYIDVTWDDTEGIENTHTYLDMSETEFLKEGSHILSKEEIQRVHTVSNAFFMNE